MASDHHHARAGFPPAREASVLCAVCQNTLSWPKMLSCLHAVCQSCLPLCTRPDGSLVCPHDGCARLTAASLVHFGLPDHHLLRHELQSRDGGKAEKRCCNECLEDEAEKATAMCEDCCSALCEFHVLSHKRGRSTAQHRLKEVTQSFAELSAETTAKCTDHAGIELTKFCRACNVVVCEYCASTGHAGHDVTDAAPVVQDFSKEMEDLSEFVEKTAAPELKRRLSTVQTNIRNVNDRAEEMSAGIAGCVQKAIDRLKEEERRLLNEVDKARWKELIALEKEANNLKGLLSISERSVSVASLSMANLSSITLLQTTVSVLPNLRQTQDAIGKQSVTKERSGKMDRPEEFEKEFLQLVRNRREGPGSEEPNFLLHCMPQVR